MGDREAGTTGRRASGVAVHVEGERRALLAVASFAAGERIVDLNGEVSVDRHRHSLQIGPGRHLAPPRGASIAERIADYPWCFLEHACEPNAEVRGATVVARRDIAAGAGITIDYESCEDEIAEPFDCTCGATACRGRIAGRRITSTGT